MLIGPDGLTLCIHSYVISFDCVSLDTCNAFEIILSLLFIKNKSKLILSERVNAKWNVSFVQ